MLKRGIIRNRLHFTVNKINHSLTYKASSQYLDTHPTLLSLPEIFAYSDSHACTKVELGPEYKNVYKHYFYYIHVI